MALARTNLLGEVSSVSFGGSPFTGTAFTPPNNSLLVVVIHGLEDLGSTANLANSFTISGGGWTYTSRVSVSFTGNGSSQWSMGTRVWTAPVTTGASMSITADIGATAAYYYAVAAVAYTGYDTSTPVGGTGTLAPTTTDGAVSLTLGASPATTSEVIGILAMDKESVGCTPGAAFSEQYDLQAADAGGIELETRTGSTSTTVDWVDDHTGTGVFFRAMGVGLEIKEAAGGGGAGSAVAVPMFMRANQGGQLWRP